MLQDTRRKAKNAPSLYCETNGKRSACACVKDLLGPIVAANGFGERNDVHCRESIRFAHLPSANILAIAIVYRRIILQANYR